MVNGENEIEEIILRRLQDEGNILIHGIHHIMIELEENNSVDNMILMIISIVIQLCLNYISSILTSPPPLCECTTHVPKENISTF
ncbi:unnamed protein product [Gordionus sp. m RMFG-2023]